MLLKQPYLKYIWVGSCSVISGIARISGAREQGIKNCCLFFCFFAPQSLAPGSRCPSLPPFATPLSVIMLRKCAVWQNITTLISYPCISPKTNKLAIKSRFFHKFLITFIMIRRFFIKCRTFLVKVFYKFIY